MICLLSHQTYTNSSPPDHRQPTAAFLPVRTHGISVVTKEPVTSNTHVHSAHFPLFLALASMPSHPTF